VTIWTALELSVAMICSSLPALRNLLLRVFPTVKLSLLSIGRGSDQGTTLVETDWKKSGIGRISRGNYRSRRATLIELVPIETGMLDLKWEWERLDEQVENVSRRPTPPPKGL
jgi:hypothetical protein